MPDTDDLKKTVDLDTSGPAMDVDVPETKEEDCNRTERSSC